MKRRERNPVIGMDDAYHFVQNRILWIIDKIVNHPKKPRLTDVMLETYRSLLISSQ